MAEKKNKEIDSADYPKHLIQKGQEYKEKQERLAKEKQANADQTEGCTFKPTLQAKYHSQALDERGSPDKRKPEQIFDDLYKMKDKKKALIAKDPDLIQYEKDEEQCTFAPNIEGSKAKAVQYEGSRAKRDEQRKRQAEEQAERDRVLREQQKAERAAMRKKSPIVYKKATVDLTSKTKSRESSLGKQPLTSGRGK